MDALEDKIRLRAYELWEQAGRTGAPEDHWLQAERELRQGADDRSDATVEEAPPVDAVEASEVTGNDMAAANFHQPARRKPSF